MSALISMSWILSDAPGVGTPSQGGLTYREGQLIMEILADTKKASLI